MAASIHCFSFMLGDQLPGKLPPVVVLFGSDGFLRTETTAQLLNLAGVEQDQTRYFDGEECQWVDVHDELATLSLFGSDGLRVAVVKAADRLVKDARGSLEKWCSSPAAGSLLVLALSSFPATTKLYKLVSQNGWLIDCGLPTGGGRSKTPSEAEMKKWIVAWGKQRHQVALTASQAAMILAIVGHECGLLHQELAKLSLYAIKGKLTDEAIQQNIGTWRTRTMWEIADAIADGRAADALAQLQHVFASGEVVAGTLPQIAWSLRRYGMVAQLILQSRRVGTPLGLNTAIQQAGFFNDFAAVERRLKRMGMRRASHILRWLVDLDLKSKGSHSAPDRAVFALEELVFRLADFECLPAEK
jgi:DNA polymerase III subunit delta